MATIEFWIQLENRAWDVCPGFPINRAIGEGTVPAGPRKQVQLRSPVTGATRTAHVQMPLPDDALIFRRYNDGWTKPDDRKVNPWDLNEPNPGEAGTMGTIPGPVLECTVGDILRVHFRNLDMRTERFAAPWEDPGSVALLPAGARTHSLHSHGLTFPSKYDGAYPLSPPDPTQPIPAEERAGWKAIGAKSRFKQGDRVPPGASFTYLWEARGAASAGIWSYHDHSICDMENLSRGAIGFIVVRNPADAENEVEITPARLPGGSWTGTPLEKRCVSVGSIAVELMPYSLESLGQTPMEVEEETSEVGPSRGVAYDRLIDLGGFSAELDETLTRMQRICFSVWRQPPDQARYLLLFHEMTGVGMCINGRKFLGNAPTLVAGAKTRMRFGVLGMGETFHTFHIHGHRWAIRGPSGKTAAAIEQSAQVEAMSQFEDTKVFGPGSSFAFTIEEGQGLMRADPPLGEWHMHCHVPGHMMDGMVGSLLVVNGGEAAFTLPVGRDCPLHIEKAAPPMPSMLKRYEVQIQAGKFVPDKLSVNPGDAVTWINVDSEPHTVRALDGEFDSPIIPPGGTFLRYFIKKGEYLYDCTLHRHYYVLPRDSPAYEPQRFAPRIICGAVAPAGGGSTPAPAAATTHNVKISSTGFTPASLNVKVGDTVRWTNGDQSVHNVQSDDHAWASPTLPANAVWSKIFGQPGTVAYHCHFHHEMTASIAVSS